MRPWKKSAKDYSMFNLATLATDLETSTNTRRGCTWSYAYPLEGTHTDIHRSAQTTLVVIGVLEQVEGCGFDF